MATPSGVLTAMVTPFTDDGGLDLPSARRLARHLVENGSHGIVVAGTTGESPTLSDAEKIQLWEAAVDALRGRATVVAGIGTYDTAHTVHLAKRAAELDVDALLVVTPYYNLPPQRAIVRHFETIADQAVVRQNRLEPQIERLDDAFPAFELAGHVKLTDKETVRVPTGKSLRILGRQECVKD